jgi:protein ImuA
MRAAGHNYVLDDLRARIAHLEHGHSHRRAPLPTGVAPIDAHLGGGLARGALHEIIGGGAELRHGAAAALFAASILGRDGRTVLWVLPARDLFAPGLAAAGLHPDRLIYAETGAAAMVLPVAEEALRHCGLAGVVAEPTRLSLTASRRLQLAAESSGVTALVLHRWSGQAEPALSGTVAVTRWRLTALASASLADVPGLGDPRWRLELLRFRGGTPGAWTLEACDETGRLRVAADVADRPAETGIRRAAG